MKICSFLISGALCLLVFSCSKTEIKKQKELENNGNQNLLVPNIVSDFLSFSEIRATLDSSKTKAIKPQTVSFKSTKSTVDNVAKKEWVVKQRLVADTSLYTKRSPGKDGIAMPVSHKIPDTGYVLFNKDTVHAPKKILLKHASSVATFPMRAMENTRYDLTYLDTDLGLKSNLIRSLATDSIGNIWIATFEARLLKFDGVSVMDYTEHLPGNREFINQIRIDANNVLWIAFDRGIARFDGQTYTHYNSGLLNTPIRSMAIDHSGNIWCVSSGGLIKVFRDVHSHLKVTKYTIENGLENDNIRSVYVGQDNIIYVGTDRGISMFKNNTFYHPSHALGLEGEQQVWGIAQDSKGAIWFASNDRIYKLKPTDGSHIIEQLSIEISGVYDLMVDSQDRIWVSSVSTGVTVIEDTEYIEINANHGLSEGSVLQTIEDSYGNIWTTTLGGGITKLNLESFRHDPYSGNHIAETINDICLDSKENLWFGTAGGLYKYNDYSYDYYPMTDGGGNIQSVYEDHTYNLWFGGLSGFYTYEENTLRYYQTGFRISLFFEDVEGTIWMVGVDNTTFKGKLLRYENGVLYHYSETLNDTIGKVTSIVQDKKERLWFASNSGLYMYHPKQPNTFYKVDNIADFQPNDLVINEKDELVIGASHGIYRFVWEDPEKASSAKVIHYTKPDGTFGESGWNISVEKNGNLWMGFARGVKHLNLTEEGSFKTTLYNKDNGFFGNTSLIMKSLSYEDKDMLLWASSKGLTYLNMNEYETSITPPAIQLKTIKINQKSIDYKQLQDSTYTVDIPRFDKLRPNLSEAVPYSNYPKNLELPYRLNHLTFQFSAIDWNNPNTLQYQYMIQGLDNQWSELSKSNEADYRNIPYGDYTFKVRALGNSGLYSEPFSYSFLINPPWWHTWWARTLFITLFILGIYLFIKWRIAIAKDKLEKQAKQEQVIKDLQASALRAQMNPHFIFNALNGLQSVMILKGELMFNGYLGAFSRLLRSTLEMSAQAYISIEKEITYLKAYLDLEKMRMNEELDVTFTIDKALDQKSTTIPCMLFQPIVENAILHGLLPKKGNKRIEVAFYEKDAYLYGEVTDNGIGRKASAILKNNKSEKHNSHATRIMKERIDIRNTIKREKIAFEIIDLYEGENASGTKVCIKIPLSYI